MGRIRSIKPDFFLHEGLAAMSPLHRLLFVGLWTLADKDGRMEDRPKRIKVALLPWEDCDVDAMLWDLAEARLIVRYDGRTAEGAPAECIAIPAFKKHQRPHPKESAFGLSEPDLSTASRVRPRKEIKPTLPIPSSPAGKEVLEGGKEVLDPPKPGGANSVSAMSGTSAPPFIKAVVGVAEGGGGDLRSGIERLWLRYRGSPWAWKHKDELDLRPAFDLAGGDLRELLRVFESGLQKTYPKLTKLAHLTEHWNDYAAKRGPEPARPGRASASDTAWGDDPDTGPEILQPLEAMP